MRILYVCTGNSFRSPVAEALTRTYKPEWEVESAGTNAADHIAENAKKLLKFEDAEQHVKPEPDQLSERAVEEADRIVAMTSRHKNFLEDNFDLSRTDVKVWNVEDPINPYVDPEDAFVEIIRKVKQL